MIILLGLAAGLVVGWAAGGSLRGLATFRIKGEGMLLGVLVLQAVLPALMATMRASSAVRYWAWIVTFIPVIAVALMNSRSPGFPAVGLGAAANLLVISVNMGMPVSAVAMRAAGYGGSFSSPPALLQGVTHHLVGPSDALLVLADVMPIRGPAALQAAVSVGDVLLVVGVVSYLVCGMTSPDGRVSGAS